MLDLFQRFHAEFSPCRTYRYTLSQQWNTDCPQCIYILLNPSTADEFRGDPTVNRCVKRAMINGYGGITVLNIFSLRSKDPRLLYQVVDPIGPGNDTAIHEVVTRRDVGQVIVGWGIHGKLMGRGNVILANLRTLGITPYALVLTKDGIPGHPLYVAFEKKPFVF